MKVILAVDAIKYPLTGIGRYTFELARALQHAELRDLLFLRGARLDRVLSEPSRPMARGRSVKSRLARSPLLVDAADAVRARRRQWVLRHHGDSVLHGPNFYLPPFGGVSVVTVHDLSPYLWAHTHPAERVRYIHRQVERALRQASAIITDAEYTRREVASHFGWPFDRIHAVPLACGPEFHPRTSQQLSEPLAQLGLSPGSYTLFTGSIEPRKNLITLLDAYSRLPIAERLKTPLVLCGPPGWKSDAIHQRIRSAQVHGWARYLGYVSPDLLPILVAGASLFVYPSYYEGFGLPLLEAMASGVPIVCSNASTLPEVAGPVPLYHAPDDVPGLTEQLRRGLHDTVWRKAAIRAGLQRCQSYSWARTAQLTLNAYYSARSNPAPRP